MLLYKYGFLLNKMKYLNEIIVAIRIKEKNFPLIQKELFVIFFR